VNTIISRAQFIRGNLSGRHSPIRPPGSKPEIKFLEACTQCKECITACPEGILVRGAGRYPQINFMLGECTFCGECATHCNSHAFIPQSTTPERQAWSLRAFINNQCLVLKKVLCEICKDQCEQQAISFHFQANTLPYPVINSENCTGCGACYGPCPTNAIQLRSP